MTPILGFMWSSRKWKPPMLWTWLPSRSPACFTWQSQSIQRGQGRINFDQPFQKLSPETETLVSFTHQNDKDLLEEWLRLPALSETGCRLHPRRPCLRRRRRPVPGPGDVERQTEQCACLVWQQLLGSRCRRQVLCWLFVFFVDTLEPCSPKHTFLRQTSSGRFACRVAKRATGPPSATRSLLFSSWSGCIRAGGWGGFGVAFGLGL